MTKDEFEEELTKVAVRLSKDILENPAYREPRAFEDRARKLLGEFAKRNDLHFDPSFRPQTFPDIVIGSFGVEVKVNSSDSWRSVANSVFEGTRDENVRYVYVLFGKMGGTPSVQWGRYEDCVMHVRTSHVPRFEVEIGTKKPLFEKFKVSYQEFCELPPEGKMKLIRQYSRGRLKKGERLWWLEDKQEPEHSLPLEVRLYMNLPQAEKRKLRAEAALLCPQVVKPSRTRNKYNDASIYLLTYYGVMCPQARDLFSAGSVALRADETRGGIYIMRSLKDIEGEMMTAARRLEDALFVEYWGESVPPADRIQHWLDLADGYAKGWRPSEHLFQHRRR